MDQSDPNLKASKEHIIPLSLGGSDGLTINAVSVASNNRVGKEIDDPVASSLPFLIQRHKYALQGNRGVVPSIKFHGQFEGSPLGDAQLSIDNSGNLTFELNREKTVNGPIVELRSTEDQVRKILAGYLRSADQRGKILTTPFGRIRDAEDIEAAIALADRISGKVFAAPIQFDLNSYHENLVRLSIKIALGLGHRVLGREWSYGPGGMLLRQALFPKNRALLPNIRGTTRAQFSEHTRAVLGILPDRHLLAVMPVEKRTMAVIALFGGELGVSVVNLGFDARRLIRQQPNLEAIFEIPLRVGTKSRPTTTRGIASLAEIGIIAGLI